MLILYYHITSLTLPLSVVSLLGQYWRRVFGRSSEYVRSELVQRKGAQSGVRPPAEHGPTGKDPAGGVWRLLNVDAFLYHNHAEWARITKTPVMLTWSPLTLLSPCLKGSTVNMNIMGSVYSSVATLVGSSGYLTLGASLMIGKYYPLVFSSGKFALHES